MGFFWRGGDVGGLRRLGSGLEPREPRSAAARAVRASFAELDLLEVGASYRSVIHETQLQRKQRPSRASAFLKTLFCLQAPCPKKGICFFTNLYIYIYTLAIAKTQAMDAKQRTMSHVEQL